MQLDGTLLRTLDEGMLGEPTVTRDGKWVVYWKADNEDAPADSGALFITPFAGTSKAIAITDPRDGWYADPACSPTADVVISLRLTARNKGSGLGLVSIDLAKGPGAEPVPLTQNPSDVGPSWAPDGSRFLFRRQMTPGSAVFLFDRNRGSRLVLRNWVYAASPIWTSR